MPDSKYWSSTQFFSHASAKRSDVLLFVVSIVLFLCVLCTASSAYADVRVAHTTLVSEDPSALTPRVVDGRVEAIAIDGDTVFVGGTFTQIQEVQSDEIIDQAYLFAYNKVTGAIIREFDPLLNNIVRALQNTGEGAGIFVGGNFTAVNDENNIRGLVKLNDSGDRVLSFSTRIDSRIKTLDRSGNTLYIGGNFRKVNDQPRELLAAVNTSTGSLLPKIDLDFEGEFSTVDTTGFASVDIIEVTSDDQLMVLVGNFGSINGVSRSRLAVLELGNQATVSEWNTDVYDTQCPVNRFPQYIEGLDIAPDDAYFLVGTKGGHLRGNPACHTILRFDLDDLENNDVRPTWRTFTGGDSVYEVAAAEHVVYVGGHFRWLNNGLTIPGDEAAAGSIARRGLAALDPRNGLPLVDWRSDRNPRGVGIFALEVQPEGLYIGDDTDFLNGEERPKLKFLPTTNSRIQRPDVPSLPTAIVNVNASTLEAMAFDGNAAGASSSLSASGWNNSRGAMFLDENLFHADDEGNMWVSKLGDDGTFENRTPVDLRGLTLSDWDLSRLSGMFFDHEQGRLYYTLENESRLLWRAFTPDGLIFGDFTYIAAEQGDIIWSDVRGMDVIGGHLYYGRTDGRLYRSDLNGSSPVSGSSVAVSGAGLEQQDWSDPFFAFSSDLEVAPPVAPPATPPADTPAFDTEFEFEGSADLRSFRRFEFMVAPGESVEVQLIWDDPSAQLNVVLNDGNNDLVDANIDVNGPSPKVLTAPAGEGGIYTVAVKIRSGSTAYKVGINTTQEETMQEPPEAPEVPELPDADLVFSSSGSTDSGRWQVFNFDVNAGDLIEAQVIWNNPDSAVRLFLRDDENAQVDRDTDESGSPEAVSATVPASGRWSIGVGISRGSVDYHVLINITEGLVEIEPTNVALNKTAIQSTTDFGGSASRAVDGNTSGRYGDRSVTHTRGAAGNHWWRVDLGAVYDISQINVFNRTDCCNSRLDGGIVYFGNNNSIDPADYARLGELTGSTSVQSFNDVNGTGRYVMIIKNDNSTLSLAEVQVMAVPAANRQ